jgi:hypothetical protein
MTTKDEVHEALVLIMGPELAEVWWEVPLPAFGGNTAEWLWAKGERDQVITRVEMYNS